MGARATRCGGSSDESAYEPDQVATGSGGCDLRGGPTGFGLARSLAGVDIDSGPGIVEASAPACKRVKTDLLTELSGRSWKVRAGFDWAR